MRLTRHALAVLLTFLLLSHSSPTHIPEAVSKPAPKPTMVFPVMATGAAALYEAWSLESAGLSREAFEKAYAGYTQFKERSMLKVTRLLTIVDYSLSSAKKRLFVLDMDAGKMVFNPSSEERLEVGDSLIALAEAPQLKEIERRVRGEV